MLVNSDAILGRSNAGKPIGYSVLTLNREPYAAFTTDNVLETAPGRYVAVGGVNVPDTGAFVVWGLANRSIAEDVIQPAPIEMMAAFTRRMSDQFNQAVTRLLGAIPAPVVQMQTSHFDNIVAQLRQDLDTVAQRQQSSIAEIDGRVSEAVQHLRVLDSIDQAARDLSVVADRIDELFGAQSLAAQMFRGSNNEHHIAETMEIFRNEMKAFRGEIDHLALAIQSERPVKEKLRQGLALMDKFLESVEREQR